MEFTNPNSVHEQAEKVEDKTKPARNVLDQQAARNHRHWKEYKGSRKSSTQTVFWVPHASALLSPSDNNLIR